MDALALISVITGGILGAGGIAASVWTTRQTLRAARQGRVEERRIDAYLDILKIIEHQNLWHEHRILNAEEQGDVYADKRTEPLRADPSERATLSALATAYASNGVRATCRQWLEAVEQLDTIMAVASWNWEQDYHGPETPTGNADLAALRAHRTLLAQRTEAVEKAIRAEVQAG